MLVAQTEVGRGYRERTIAGQTTKQDRGSHTTASKVIVMEDGKTPGQVHRAVRGTKHVPVTFWVPDGSCAAGKTHHIGDEVIFIESKRVVPVDTEVAIRLNPANEVLVNWGVANGTVVSHCPAEDHFRNREGFGVCLQGRWPQPPGLTELNDPKETV